MHRLLFLSAGVLLFAAPSGAEDRVSTMQPFAVGDIFVAATVMDVPD